VILRQYIRYVAIPIILICTVIFLLMLVQRLSSLSVWDDAYFFVRYADNFLTYGNLSWNLDGVPTYGLTSPAYLLVVIPLRLLLPSQPALVMLSASLLCGLSLFLCIVLLARKILNQAEQVIFWIVCAISAVVAGEHITTHLTSGMDTMFAIMMLSIWLRMVVTSERYGVIGGLGGLFLWIRPDVLLIIVGVLSAKFIYISSYSQKAKIILGFSLALFLEIALNTFYYGHPLPLPFYAKSTVVYGDAFYAYYENTSERFLLDFIVSYLYLVILSVVGLALKTKNIALSYGLIIGSILFTAYQFYAVVPVMGFSQRFYYPLVPVLLLLAMLAIQQITQKVPTSIISTIQLYSNKSLLIPFILLLAFINPLPIVTVLVNYTKPNIVPVVSIMQFDLQTAYTNLYSDSWYGLDELSTLNDNIVIATTEIGLPGVMNPQKQIIDLAGLNDRTIAESGLSADKLLLVERPDWIYLPFPHYEDMWYSIFNHPNFQLDYHYVSAQSLGTSMDVAIRRDSLFYRDMLEIVNSYD